MNNDEFFIDQKDDVENKMQNPKSKPNNQTTTTQPTYNKTRTP